MEKKPKRKKIWMIPAVTILVIILIVTAARMAIKSTWLFDMIRDMAIEQAGHHLNGTLAIESIKGDLLFGFVVKNIRLSDENESQIAAMDSLVVRYTLSSLIRSPHTVDAAELFGTDLRIIQNADSSWNVIDLFGEPDTDKDDTESIFWGIDRFTISHLNADIRSDYFLPEGYLNIYDLNAIVSGGMSLKGFYGTLDKLEFHLDEARMPQQAVFNLSAAGDADKVTLESLVLNTGRTMLQASGNYQSPNNISKYLEISPLSWRDLILYADDLPLRQDLNIQLGIEGTRENLQLNMNIGAIGADKIELNANMNIKNSPVLTYAAFHSSKLNLPLLTGLDNLPVIDHILISGEGNIQFDEWQNASFHGEFIAENAILDPYKIDRLTSEISLEKGNVFSVIRLYNNHELMSLQLSFDELFEEEPRWKALLNAESINLAGWAADHSLDSDINVRVEMTGSGIARESVKAGISARSENGRIGAQKFSSVSFDGTVDAENITGEMALLLSQSMAVGRFSIDAWQGLPEYSFDLTLRDTDLTEIEAIDALPTNLNGNLKGYGRTFDIGSLYLETEMTFDSSFVNGEMIDTFRANLKIENEFAMIDEAILQSPIADATINLRQHLTEFLNPENRFQFAANIKDLYPLKPLFGLDELDATGTVNGTLTRNNDGNLYFKGFAELDTILVDTLFSSTKAVLSTEALLMEIPEISINLELLEPAVFNIGVQDVQFHAMAEVRGHQTSGMTNFQLINGNESLISHSGNFLVDSTQTVITTTDLTISTTRKTLALRNTFDLTYSRDVFRMDTLSIASADYETHLRLWIPHADTLRQEAGMDAKNLNLGELQEAIMESRFIDGILSGFIEVANSSEELKVESSIQINAMEYEAGRMDSLRFDTAISGEWLQAELNAWNNGGKLMEGNLLIPFVAEDPATFDELFFERDISGQFEVFDSPMAYWFAFTPDGLPEETAGAFSMRAALSGVAGSPELSGEMEITTGLFSGISIDRVAIGIDYIHEEATLDFSGDVVKDQDSILGFKGYVPLNLDLRQARIDLPSDEDSVSVHITTNDFDLRLLNNYTDPDILRNLAGRIEGDVSLSGTVENLEMNGSMQLSNGTLRIVPAGITLNETVADLLFEPDKITLRQFSTRSGPGRLRAVGSADVDALQPGNINIEVTASQFRIMNTPEYNFLVNLNTRMDGSFTEPRLMGDIHFLTGLVNLQNFGDRALEAVTLEEETEKESFDFYDALAMELNIDFGRQFNVRNRQYLDLEFFLGGSIDVLKEKQEELQMFGSLEGLRGFARPFGRNFDMEEAVVAFYGPTDDPQLNIRTRYEPPQSPGVRLYYVIDGTLQNPEFRFESEPELELQDIISYTLFGKPFYELDSWEQVVAGSGSSPTAADVALDVLLDRVEMMASQRLGIDVVQIDNTRSGSRNSTSIKTGWYLNRRTFFAILNEVGSARPKTLFMLEYLLLDNLELIITQGDDSREGIDLRWRHDY